MKPQIKVFNQFYGGLSNDRDVGGAGMFDNGINVDVKDSKGVKLARNNIIDFYNVSLRIGPPVSIFTGTNNNLLIIYREGYIYTKKDGNNNSEMSFTHCYNSAILSNNGDGIGILLDGGGKIKKWNFSNTDGFLGIGGSASNLTLAIDLDINFNKNSLIYQLQNSVYVTDGHNTIVEMRLDSSDNLILNKTQEIDVGYQITYITNIGDQLIIYAKNGNNGRQYFWDGLSDTFQRNINWYDKPILGGVTLNNVDYIVCGNENRRELYLVNGYQPQKLYGSDLGEVNNKKAKFYFAPEFGVNTFETMRESIVIPGLDKYYIYGNNKIGLPKGIISNWIKGEIVAMHYSSNQKLLYVCTEEDDNRYHFKEINMEYPKGGNHFDTKPGKIETLNFMGSLFSQEKEALKMRIGYKLGFQTSINIYARTNFITYANFYIENFTNVPKIGDIYRFKSDFEIYDITNNNNKGLILHCKTTNKNFNGEERQFKDGTLTKKTGNGNGDNSLVFYDSDYGYKLIKKITDENTTSDTFMLRNKLDSLKFNEIQLKADLITGSENRTPILYDMILVYNIIENEI